MTKHDTMTQRVLSVKQFTGSFRMIVCDGLAIRLLAAACFVGSPASAARLEGRTTGASAQVMPTAPNYAPLVANTQHGTTRPLTPISPNDDDNDPDRHWTTSAVTPGSPHHGTASLRGSEAAPASDEPSGSAASPLPQQVGSDAKGPPPDGANQPDSNPPRSGKSEGAENAPADDEITPKLEEAVRKGFDALRRLQKSDGSFGQGRYGSHVGVTSLGAIAFMADGNVPGRGDYGDSVRKALEFILAHATETGLLVSDETHGPMYGHGFATLFLGEVYGMNQSDDKVRDALVRAVQLIVSSQNDEGGWRYNPVPNDADVSVTICQIMALRSARNAGIKVPKSTIDDAVKYVRECQNEDGGFRYMKDTTGSLWPRTAAGVASLFYAGVYEDRSIERGLDYLRANAFPRGGKGAAQIGFSQPHYFYGHYYAVQAMYLAGGDRWREWWPAIRDELLSRQSADGSWSDPQNGEAYGTAMALIVLQMPKRYLPIFQR